MNNGDETLLSDRVMGFPRLALSSRSSSNHGGRCSADDGEVNRRIPGQVKLRRRSHFPVIVSAVASWVRLVQSDVEARHRKRWMPTNIGARYGRGGRGLANRVMVAAVNRWNSGLERTRNASRARAV